MTGSELTLAQSIRDEPITVLADAPEVLPIYERIGGPHGPIPHACAVLTAWPTGFRTLQILACGLLDLPRSVVNPNAVNELVGLAMYESSSTAACSYSAAHASSYAVGRGLHPAAISGRRLPREQAAADLAVALTTTSAHRSAGPDPDYLAHLSRPEQASIASAVGFIGFLNTFCSAMGLDVERETADVVIDLREQSETNRVPKSAGADTWRASLLLASAAPASAILERQWLKGVSGRASLAIRRLERSTGVSFELLAHLKNRRATRAVAATLRDNLDNPSSTVTVREKALAALTFAAINDAATLETQAQRAILHRDPATSVDLFEAVRIFALEDPATTDTFMLDRWLGPRTIDVLLLARAASATPSVMTADIITQVRTSLTASEVVEVVVWLSIQQVLARLGRFFSPDQAEPAVGSD